MLELAETEEPRDCKICATKNAGFNYGVQSCNSCKMFFRRALDTSKMITCKKEENCNILDPEGSKCRFCRFHKCVLVGMKFLDSPQDPTAIINDLLHKDWTRNQHFLTGKAASTVKFKDIFERGVFLFEKKSEDTVFDFYEWGVMNHLTCINFETSLSFMKYLSKSDLTCVLKSSHLLYMIFVTAWRSYTAKKEFMCHPDGSDIFPSEVEPSAYNEKLINEIRCYLLSCLICLRVTEEEFLLLGVIIVCNPGIPDLSQTGRMLLASYQSMYGQTLQRYCSFKYGSNAGALRYLEIISLSTAIARCHSAIANFSTLFPIHQPQHVKVNLFTEILAFLIK
ncbi:unnamed protein product [Caenorhabditis brenneri]